MSTSGMLKVASGIFMWDAGERRSNRYGSFFMTKENYDGDAQAEVTIEPMRIATHLGHEVIITCVVRATRKSGHIGDLFLGITPSQPEVGEEIVLGVGTFASGKSEDGSPLFITRPKDGRDELWIDPRKLYRLHDQTADVYIRDATPGDEVHRFDGNLPAKEDGALAAGDGYIQVKRVDEGATIGQHIERLGDGMFMMGPGKLGDRLPVYPKGRKS